MPTSSSLVLLQTILWKAQHTAPAAPSLGFASDQAMLLLGARTDLVPALGENCWQLEKQGSK